MPRPREIMVGSRDQFGVKIVFLPDPDDGRAATPEHSVSWGASRFGRTAITSAVTLNRVESIGAVHWYLLPILQWLASNWDFLLHEERLPVRNAARDAWISMHARQTRRQVFRNMLPNSGRKAGTTGGNVIPCWLPARVGWSPVCLYVVGVT